MSREKSASENNSSDESCPANDSWVVRQSGYRWYVLTILFVAYVINIIDRHIVNILVEPIKRDLLLTDTQAGFLIGFAFAVFYTLLGVPIATLADRYNRAKLIAFSAALWSVMTAVTGAANSYLTLALSRMGVGVGEAGLTPAANSIIGDIFEPSVRGRSLSLYYCAGPVGGMLAGLIGGWLENAVGWRMTFVILGCVGMVIAALVRLTLREPPRGLLDNASSAPEQSSYSIRETIVYLIQLKTCRYFMLAFAFLGLVGSAIAAWTPAFYLRSHEVSLMHMASVIGFVGGVGGAAGMLSGGIVSDYFGPKDSSLYMKIPAYTALIMFPFSMAIYYVDQFWLSAVLYLSPVITLGLVFPPVLVVLQRLVKNNMRATSLAIFLVVANLIGMGFGPLLVGMLSDLLAPSFAEDSLQISLLLITPLYLVGAVFFFLASRHVKQDLLDCESNNGVSNGG